MPGKGLLQAFGCFPCFKGAAGGKVRPSVDKRDGEDDGLPWVGTKGESGELPGNPPASMGSGWKRGETCTFMLECEGDANGTSCPWELVLEADVEGRKGGGEYCRTEDEDKDD